MSEKFVTKTGDTKPIRAILKDENGPVDLTGATVRFHLQNLSGDQIIDKVAEIVDAERGEVKYDFESTETANEGDFEAEFEATFPSGEVATFPDDTYIVVVVLEDRAP